jgi:hypothetical protein
MVFLSILSSSPEEFLYVGPREERERGSQNKSVSEYGSIGVSGFKKERYIRTRPVKGTLPLGITEIDPKNQAENLMIVDLDRNDLGRICQYGSINVSKLLEVENYKHLNHVVSTIEGKLRDEVKLRDIFEATFPGGSPPKDLTAPSPFCSPHRSRPPCFLRRPASKEDTLTPIG